ncbi:ribbon-helix-helix protein, CopG family [Methanobacterium sp. SMA-27]|uniref:ribbon-helix-helix protein, CopG family n=1 Tax=Methanobacterium sp. SMA-27 TaxID=1495336 RepID=UPI0012E08568
MLNRMTFRIDENLKEQFRTFCEKKDISCSEMLRRLILMWIGKESEHDLILKGA